METIMEVFSSIGDQTDTRRDSETDSQGSRPFEVSSGARIDRHE